MRQVLANAIDIVIAAVIFIPLCCIAFSCTSNTQKPLFYNAYSPTYDEFFVIASYRPLDNKSVVWFDDNARAVDYVTPYVARIISPYKSN